MKKIAKRVGIVFGVLIVLLLLAAIIVPMVINFNSFKPQIAEVVKTQTGRDLVIGGDIKLRILPRFSLDLKDVTFSNAQGFSPENMAQIGELSVGVKVFPLLRKEIEISRVIVEGMELYYAVNKDGVTNIDDILALHAADPAEAAAPAPEPEPVAEDASGGGFDLAGATVGLFKIKDMKLSYADARSNVNYILSDINIEAEDVGLDKPVDLELSAKFEETQSKMAVDLQLAAALHINSESASVNLKSSEINVNIPQQGLSTTINIGAAAVYDMAAKLADVSRADLKAKIAYKSGETSFNGNINIDTAVKADLEGGLVDVPSLKLASDFTASMLNGKQSASADAALTYDLNKQNINLKNLKLTVLGIIMNIKASGALSPDMNLKGSLAINEFNPQNVMKAVNVDYTPTDKTALTKFSASADFTFAKNVLNLPLKMNLDDTAVTTAVNVNLGGKKLAIGADIALNSIDVDRYMPAPSASPAPAAKTAAAPAAPAGPAKIEFPDIKLDLTGLPDIDADFKADSVTVTKSTYQGITASADLKNGIAGVNFNVNNLFSGKLTSNARVTAQQNKFDALLNAQVTSVNLHNMLKAFAPDMDLAAIPKIGGVDLSASVKDKVVTVSKLNITADKYRVNSNMKADFTPKDKPMITVKADVNDVNVRDFVPKTEEGDAKPASPASTPAPVPAGEASESTPLDLNSIPVNLDATLAVKSVTMDNIKVSAINAHAKVNNGIAEITPLTGSTFGGTFKVNGKLTSKNGKLPADLHVDIDNIKVGDVIQAFKAGKVLFSGDLDANADITTAGITVDDILTSINGKADYKLKNGVAHGIGYNPNLVSLDTLKTLNLFSNNKQTKIKDVDGSVTFQNGRMNMDTVKIDSDYLKGRMKGGIMLADRTLNFDGTINVENVEVPMSVTGPLSDPKITIDSEKLISGLIQQYAKKTATGVIKAPVTVPTEILDGVGKGLDKLFNK